MRLVEYTLSQCTISDITSKSIDDNGLGRATFVGAEVKHVQFGSSLIIQYDVESSENTPNGVDDYGNFTYNGRNYLVTLEFKGVKQVSSPQELANIIQNGDVRVNCTCPAFYWQGMWEHDHPIKADYPRFRGTPGNDVWDARHGVDSKTPQLCKHLWKVSQQIDVDINKIYNSLVKYGRTGVQPAQPTQPKKRSWFSRLFHKDENEEQPVPYWNDKKTVR